LVPAGKVGEREAVYADGETRPFDIMITFPAQVAAVEYAGLPADDPVKQAYLATLQGTAAALDIVAGLRGISDLRIYAPYGGDELRGLAMARQPRLADDGMW